MANREHNTLTGAELHFTRVATGTGAPVTAPPWTGAVYFDTAGPIVYYSKGTSSPSDWTSIVGTSAIDTIFFIINNADNSKRFRFDASAISTATSRILSVQNASYILAGINIAQTFSQVQTFSSAAIFAAGLTVQAAGEVVIQGGRAVCLNNPANSFAVRHRAAASGVTQNSTYSWGNVPSVAGQVLTSDTSGNLEWSAGIAASMAANDANTTFTSASPVQQLGNLPTAARDFTLPASLTVGIPWTFYNNATVDGRTITLKASGGQTIDYVIPTQRIVLVPKSSTPTTAADWQVIEAESSWVAYTPTFTALGTVADIAFFYKRSRSNMYIKGFFRPGTPDAVGTANFSIPTGFEYVSEAAVGFGSTMQMVGTGQSNGVANKFVYTGLASSPSPLDKVWFAPSTNPTFTGTNAIDTFSALVPVSLLEFPIKISGWN